MKNRDEFANLQELKRPHILASWREVRLVPRVRSVPHRAIRPARRMFPEKNVKGSKSFHFRDLLECGNFSFWSAAIYRSFWREAVKKEKAPRGVFTPSSFLSSSFS